ncbi:MAG: lysylphosphatidylglycerol synthase domain-containing protein [Elusimicrobiota bacterium]
MRLVQAVILVVGLVMLGLLLWKLDAHAVWGLVAQVGWGFVFIIGQEIGAHLLNALGWRFAYSADHAESFRYRDLLKFRVVGDSVNYLTPSAQLAGEFARASLLNPAEPVDVRVSGVVVGKFCQGLSQFLFALTGIGFLLRGRIPWLAPYEPWLRGLVVAAAVVGALMLVYELRSERPEPAKRPEEGGLHHLPRHLIRYIREHPGRLACSVGCYGLGFAWGAFEAYWICRFLGAPVSFATAIAIESLSCVFDAMCFFVPAKMGSQEAGKTAIFALLGLGARTGLAFGVVRHIRELTWAASGMLLYTLHVKKTKN